MRKVIISLAPVEAGLPVDKEALAEDVVRSAAAGAAMCHLHCRRPDGSLTPDITEMADTFDRIAERTDLIIQASTGGISDMDIRQRCYPLDYWRVESASLNGGTTNLGEAVYINTFEDIRLAVERGASYIGLGPYRFTGTKKNLSPILGLDGYRKIIAQCKEAGIDIPICAIGGITLEDVGPLMETGITGIAVSGAIINASDPVEETRRFIEEINKY